MESIRHALDVGATAVNWWLALSGVVNVMLRLKPLEAWVGSLERTRAGGAVVGVVRSLGLDPVVAAQVLITALNARALGAGLSAVFATPAQASQGQQGGEGGGS